MKKIINHGLFLVLVSVFGFSQNLKAQDATKEIAGFVKKFQDAYNAKDATALKEMYKTDAVSTDGEGNVDNGNEAIIARLKNVFDENTIKIAIKQDKVETGADGNTVATGTYQLTGKTPSGEDINIHEKYSITMSKEKGRWKIAKSVLSKM